MHYLVLPSWLFSVFSWCRPVRFAFLFRIRDGRKTQIFKSSPQKRSFHPPRTSLWALELHVGHMTSDWRLIGPLSVVVFDTAVVIPQSRCLHRENSPPPEPWRLTALQRATPPPPPPSSQMVRLKARSTVAPQVWTLTHKASPAFNDFHFSITSAQDEADSPHPIRRSVDLSVDLELIRCLAFVHMQL